MKKFFAVTTAVVLSSFLFGTGCAQKAETKALQAQSASAAAVTATAATVAGGEQIAVIETTKGVIKFKFYQADAPLTCKNFIDLTNKGFYNGLTFHRVEPNFVIQGGDPNGNGTGGPGYTIKAEFNKNKHLEGTVAMARAQDPNSAGSQFYICLAPAPFLDNNYTVFGQVTEGLDVVHKIAVGDKMTKVTIETAK
jgi:peptidyl-prolyl cis-trans isomerase B (cyclophilin B)